MIINKVIDQACKMLAAANAKYIVVLPDGTERVLGDLRVAPPPKRKQKIKRGVYSSIYKDQIKNLKVGDVFSYVTPDDVDPRGFRSSASTFAAHLFGNGNVTSAVDPERRLVEILRLA
jgi:hypothetical protein